MDKTNKVSSFITEDIAYFLGLIVGRGTIINANELKKLVIDFPFKNLKAESPIEGKKYDNLLYLSNSLDKIVVRLLKLGVNLRKENDDANRSVSLIIEWRYPDLTWLFINYLLNDEFTNYHEFRIPKAIFQCDKEKQKEFIRGLFDVTGHARASNYAFDKKDNHHRVYFEIDNQNWFLTLDLFHLLTNLDVPVQTINFGHPNFRDPNHTKKGTAWAKEHQFKIFANQYLRIGSYLQHKQEVLQDLANLCPIGLGDDKGPQKKRVREKPSHTDESSQKLPALLRNKHFNHYTELLDFLKKNDPIEPYGS